jgi:hypothetical protein
MVPRIVQKDADSGKACVVDIPRGLLLTTIAALLIGVAYTLLPLASMENDRCAATRLPLVKVSIKGDEIYLSQ